MTNARSVRLQKRANGNYTVVAEVYDEKQRAWVRRSMGTRPWHEADLLKRQLEREAALTTTDLDLQRMTVSDALERWQAILDHELEVGKIQVRTHGGHGDAARLHIRPRLGHVRLGDLTQQVVYNWTLDLGGKLAPRTVRRIWLSLRRCLRDIGIEPNPADLPKRQRPSATAVKEIVRPAPGQVGAFLSHIEECSSVAASPKALFRLMAEHGLRLGELAGLSWQDIDLEAGTLAIRRSMGERGSRLFMKVPKTAHGVRTHLLTSAAHQALLHHRAWHDAAREAAGDEWLDPFEVDLVFRLDESGFALRPTGISYRFTAEWRRCAGLDPRVSPHCLRHANGSALVTAGMPITEVAAHLGIDVQTAMRHYLGELDSGERRRKVADVMEGLYGT